MRIIKQFFQNSGFVIMGLLGIIIVVFMVGWEIFKAFGRVIMWLIDMKIQEKYHNGEKVSK